MKRISMFVWLFLLTFTSCTTVADIDAEDYWMCKFKNQIRSENLEGEFLIGEYLDKTRTGGESADYKGTWRPYRIHVEQAGNYGEKGKAAKQILYSYMVLYARQCDSGEGDMPPTRSELDLLGRLTGLAFKTKQGWVDWYNLNKNRLIWEDRRDRLVTVRRKKR